MTQGEYLPIAPGMFPREPVLEGKVSPRFLREARVLPILEEEDRLVLAAAHPPEPYVIEAMRLVSGKAVDCRMAAADVLDAALERLYGSGKTALDKIVEDIGTTGDDRPEEDVDHLKDLASEAPVVRLVNRIIADAVRERASDIHIEPFRNELKIRFRIDGVLREMQSPPIRLAAAIVSRIKILTRLNIAERRLPQDGRATLKVDGRPIDIRVSTLPTIHGETVVMRLLDESAAIFDLSVLGLPVGTEARLRAHLSAPHGMILVTGPTGSGKTTTLGAALHILNRPGRKVLTVEDPAEYQITGVNQVTVRPSIGLNFATVLRTMVRHDPDIIMVGEMRDGETAEIAVHAALTGHLVLSTLHTNSAAGAVPRLLEMGIDAYLLASTLRAVVAQRLVRVLCPTCRTPDTVSLPHGAAPTYRAVGCEECGGTGYRGRVGIFEILEVTDEIRRLIRERAPAGDLEAAARRAGMTTMEQDGLEKCLAGVTTHEEVRRVTEEA